LNFNSPLTRMMAALAYAAGARGKAILKSPLSCWGHIRAGD
jgi:hypothetical protein